MAVAADARLVLTKLNAPIAPFDILVIVTVGCLMALVNVQVMSSPACGVTVKGAVEPVGKTVGLLGGA